MPRVSKKKFQQAFREELEDQFAFTISSLHEKNDIRLFLADFLTQEEKSMLMKRLTLYLLLQQGFRTTDIQTILGMSKETIRIHRAGWERSAKEFRKILLSLSKRNRMKEFWHRIEKLLKPIDLMLQAKSNIRARAKLLSGNPLED